MSQKKSDVEELKGILQEFEEPDLKRAIRGFGLMVKEWTDPFAFLGRGGPIFKAMCAGLEFPISNKEEFIVKAGGHSRLIIIPNSDGSETVYNLLDILEAFPEIDKLFPMKSVKDLVRKFAAIERRRKREHKTSPLLKIGGRHMKEVMAKCSAPESKEIKEISMQYHSGFPEEAGTSTILLKTLSSKESKEMLSGMPETTRLVMQNWIDWIVQIIVDYHRDAALAAAASAESYAADAEAAATVAQDATRDVAGASTNQQAQEAVDRTCAAASQAADAARLAANAAATACAHAGSIPNVTEAQTACSNARTASATASAAAARAQGDCARARDIASISIVTICGHVNEEDPCCDDDVNGASIEVRNVDYPEIPSATAITDGNGNYCVTGRFGHSSRVGCAHVTVTMNSGSGWGNISQTKRITICSHSPADVNFSFDAPGTE